MSLPLQLTFPRRLSTFLFLHGVNGHANQFDGIIKRVRSLFNDDAPHALDRHLRWQLLAADTARDAARTIDPLADKEFVSDGSRGRLSLVAHSQGALLARSVVQMLPTNLKIRTFASMAGPQKGQYGMCTMSKSGLGPIWKGHGTAGGMIAFYNPIAQNEISIANYWNDPDHSWAFRHGDFAGGQRVRGQRHHGGPEA